MSSEQQIKQTRQFINLLYLLLGGMIITLASLGPSFSSSMIMGLTAIILSAHYIILNENPLTKGSISPQHLAEMEQAQQKIETLEAELSSKDIEIQSISDDKKHMQDMLDERTTKMNSINEMLKEMLNRTDMEMEAVGQLQQSLLPKTLPEFKGYNFQHLYQPSGWASGDYFDFIEINATHMGIVLADVSGHGGRASVVMSIIRALMQTFAMTTESPSKILSRMNVLMLNLVPSEDFITMFYGIVDRGTHTLIYASAGQPYAKIIRAEDGTLIELDAANGIPLKIMAPYDYKESAIQLHPGDRLIMYTDGVIEAANDEGELFENERLNELCLASRRYPLNKQIKHIQNTVMDYCDSKNLKDDFSIVAAEFLDPEFQYDDAADINLHPCSAEDSEEAEMDALLDDMPTF